MWATYSIDLIPLSPAPSAKMSTSKKRKSHDDEPATATTKTDVSSKKRRRVSAGEGEDGAKLEKRKKKSKKDKKKRPAEVEAHPEVEGGVEAEAEEDAEAEAEANTKNSEPALSSKKSKKDKKEKKKKSSTAKTATTKTTTTEPPADASTDPANEQEGEGEAAEAEQDAKKRFIVFVGNLPYSATPTQIKEHFASVHPTSVRLLHQKNDPSRSRGVAFVEFARFDHMKTALKLFHHSTFKCPAAQPAAPSTGANSSKARRGRQGRGNANVGGGGDEVGGQQGPMEERKINVELTAGGGGNTEYRKERIRAKNEKLNEERARRAQEEICLRDKKAREKEAKNEGGDEKEAAAVNAVHPSRRRQVPGAARKD